jgi:hypothetical protein
MENVGSEVVYCEEVEGIFGDLERELMISLTETDKRFESIGKALKGGAEYCWLRESVILNVPKDFRDIYEAMVRLKHKLELEYGYHGDEIEGRYVFKCFPQGDEHIMAVIEYRRGCCATCVIL